MIRILSIVFCLFALFAPTVAADRPNILWLTCEDISPDLGCYGNTYAITPNLDKLASQGVRYTHAIGVTGVCAVNRSSLITGMYPSSIGSHDMRSRITLPRSIKCFTEYLRSAGYYCTNNSKTDYNFAVPKDAWDESSGKAHWTNRRPDQPFFAVFNYVDSHESRIWAGAHRRLAAKLSKDELHDPAKVSIPPFHPDTPEVRRDWANYHDNITGLDHWIATRLAELDEAGVADNTIVFFYSDHGAGMPGVKKWIWDGGLRVPLIIRFPEKYQAMAPGKPGSVTDRLVSFVDFAPTAMSLCGLAVPEHMQGHAFLGAPDVRPRELAFVIRDRMAERYDTIRGVRNSKYQYYRNFMPHLSWGQYMSYTFKMPTMQVWQRLHDESKLNPVQDRYFQTKPTEELYDIANDPHMINNLAGDAKYAAMIKEFRNQLQAWQLATRDLGLLPEYEMHRLAAGSSPYELAQLAGDYPLKRIMRVALAAGDRSADNIDDFAKQLTTADNATLRWWSAMGLVMLGDKAQPARAKLIEALKDESPIVRIAAAEALCNLGDDKLAMPVLLKGLEHPTPSVRLRAINVLDALGERARLAADAMRAAKMPRGTIFPGDYLNRMTGYVPDGLEKDKP